MGKNLIPKLKKLQHSLIKRFELQLDSIDGENELDVNEANSKIKLLEKLFIEFENNYTNLLAELEEEEDLEELDKKYVEIEKKYHQLSGFYIKFTGSSTENKNNQKKIDKRFDVHLPEMKLPTFDGDYKNWMKFKEMFTSMVLNNHNLEDIQRLYYLNNCTSGEAKDIINKVEFSSHGFVIAWKSLNDRYDNKKFIIERHISELFKLKNIFKESSSEIHKLINTVSVHLNALEKLGLKVSTWDMIIIHMVAYRLDNETRKLWESKVDPIKLPTWEDMFNFLQDRCRILENIENKSKPSNINRSNDQKSTNPSKFSKNFKLNISSNEKCNKIVKKCRMCNEDHSISDCQHFLNLTPLERFFKIKRFGWCINCLTPNHKSSLCKSQPCQYCQEKHHSLLHRDEIVSNKDCNNDSPPTSENITESTSLNLISNSQVLLSTAIILIEDVHGNFIPGRALLDSASESNFITNELLNKLKLSSQRVSTVSILGINDTQSKVNQTITANIKSRLNKFVSRLEFLVVPTITSRSPNTFVNINFWNLPQKIELADPMFNIPNKIDILIGAELFMQCLLTGRIKLAENFPCLQESVFGWIVSGKQVNVYKNFFLSNLQNDNDLNLDQQLKKFWEFDSDIGNKPIMTVEEKKCEKIFEENFCCNDEGRIVVPLPFNDKLSSLGNSRVGALKRFDLLEARLEKDEKLKKDYVAFMTQYEDLGHMVISERVSNREYFLPHHPILKPSSSTTKLRVVFDGSFRTDSNISLNDCLLVGPTVQNDLFSIIINFRKYPIVFTTDIEKMYRQVRVKNNDSVFQKIFWRKNKSDPIKEFELKTVTYGTSAAPYLATKALQKIALLEKDNFPLAYKVILEHTYVDDILYGANTIDESKLIIKQLNEMLNKYGMNLRKWMSNNSSLLNFIPQEDQEVLLTINESIKALGLIWNPKKDKFYFQCEIVYNNFITKRSVLSEISKLFDPLGLISPVIIRAKIFIQTLWLQKINWDSQLSNELKDVYVKFRESLHHLNSLELDRCYTINGTVRLELHGFADASQRAYGACIYIRSIDVKGNIQVHLLCSKSRVAPLKVLSIPKLELNAALLLANLVKKVVTSLNSDLNQIVLWNDSNIVLSWLKMTPHKLKQYTANRTAEIQELTAEMQWRHINGKQNPADLISRGVSAEEIKGLDLWWNGPSFLSMNESFWPISEGILMKNIPELKVESVILSNFVNKDWIDIDKFKSFTKLCRVSAYVLRYIHNLKCKSKKLNLEKRLGNLSVSEINESTKCLIKLVQYQVFNKDINYLKNKKENLINNSLKNLSPFLDHDDILRVGGRLQNCDLSFEHKHQIILPKHTLTELLIRKIHINNLHCGIQTTLSLTRQLYWPIGGKNLTKSVIHRCVVCFKANPRPLDQIMGQLPESRLQFFRPFNTTGIDFCGPFLIKHKFQRKVVTQKVYVCIFICFAIKAIHLEIVENLSSESFISCLKRFLARRGKIKTIWSDNGSNFVGANIELSKLFELFRSTQNNDVINFCSNEGIEWKFIPPRAPNFGGLWESGVKLYKFHLKRVVGSQSLTLEQFHTLTVQIEGILNSRPLTPLSTDPLDLEPLTPGHFLTGGSIGTIVEPNLSDNKLNRLSYWKLVTNMVHSFWKRFQIDYLHTLQQKRKWIKNRENVKNGDLVLVLEEQLPIARWILGKIEQIIKGRDNKVRVAVIKTKFGLKKRAISKIALLPIY